MSGEQLTPTAQYLGDLGVKLAKFLESEGFTLLSYQGTGECGEEVLLSNGSVQVWNAGMKDVDGDPAPEDLVQLQALDGDAHEPEVPVVRVQLTLG